MNAGVGTIELISQEMLAQDHILHLIIPKQGQHIGKVFGIVLAFHAQMELDLARVFLLQTADGFTVFRKLFPAHPKMGIVISIKEVRGMVRESQDPDPGIHGRADVFRLCAAGMIATCGMGMVIGDQFTHLLSFWVHATTVRRDCQRKAHGWVIKSRKNLAPDGIICYT